MISVLLDSLFGIALLAAFLHKQASSFLFCQLVVVCVSDKPSIFRTTLKKHLKRQSYFELPSPNHNCSVNGFPVGNWNTVTIDEIPKKPSLFYQNQAPNSKISLKLLIFDSPSKFETRQNFDFTSCRNSRQKSHRHGTY